MSTDFGQDQRDAELRAQIDAIFGLLAEHDESQQLDRLDALAERFPAVAVASVRRLLGGLARHGEFFEQPAAARVRFDRQFSAGESLGRWRIERELGRGGQAVALLVSRIDGGFEQQAVLKLPLVCPPSPDAVRRMLRERQLLASLKHPGLPSMIDGGVLDDGAPFLVIERIVGQPIDQYADSKRLTLRERIALLREVAAIVAYAHAQLVLHRDIKPANILIDDDGRVVLLDFGVAQSLAAEASATSVGYTLAFAAPEQVRGERSTAATDVYGLAALGCRLLGGHGPFPDLAASAQVRAVLEDAPQLPADLDRDLAAVLARALRKEPHARYASVAELDAELSRWQRHLPVLAHAGGRRYRAGKWLRRRGVLLAVASILVATTASALWQAQRATQYAAVAQHERDSATRDLRRQELLQDHYATLFNRLLSNNQPIAPEQLIEAVANTDQTVAGRDQDVQDALQFSVADLHMARNNFQAAIDVLEALAPRRERLSAWEQVGYAETLAVAYLRVGRVAEVEAVLSQGEAAVQQVPESRRNTAHAVLAIARAQLARTQGEAAGALTWARRAVDFADTDTRISPMRLGQLRINAAVNALGAGEIELAKDWTQRGLDDWQRAGLQATVNFQTALSNLANLEQLTGHPAKALARYQAIAAQGLANENAPGRWVRELSMARAMVSMGDDHRGLALADSASSAFCTALGPDALDCQRMQLAAADIANAAGDTALATRKLALITASDAAPIAASLPAVRAVLALNQTPSPATAAGADDALAALTAQGGLAVRSAIRQRLGAAERLLAGGFEALAEDLIEPLLRHPPAAESFGGIDRIWLSLWQARQAASLASSGALIDALAAELGAQHPSVKRWQTWRLEPAALPPRT